MELGHTHPNNGVVLPAAIAISLWLLQLQRQKKAPTVGLPVFLWSRLQ